MRKTNPSFSAVRSRKIGRISSPSDLGNSAAQLVTYFFVELFRKAGNHAFFQIIANINIGGAVVEPRSQNPASASSKGGSCAWRSKN